MSDKKIQILFESEPQNECPICLEAILPQALSLTNTCRHQFCLQCLSKWSEVHNSCPRCRQIFSVIISVNHLRYKNDFVVIPILKETIERQELDLRAKELKLSLVELKLQSINKIDEFRQKMENELKRFEKIDKNIGKIDVNANQNNQYFEQILKEVTDFVRFQNVSSNYTQRNHSLSSLRFEPKVIHFEAQLNSDSEQEDNLSQANFYLF